MSDVPPLTDVWGSMFYFPTPSPFGWANEESFRKRRHAAVSEEYNELIADACATSILCKKPKTNRKRRNMHPQYYRDNTGQLSRLTPTTTVRYILYVTNGDQMIPRQLKKFCQRFRLPFKSFKELMNALKIHPLFSKWKDGNKNCAGKPASPLPVLLLAALRYLGRGWCFDDCEEQTCISEETHRVFFHKFI